MAGVIDAEGHSNEENSTHPFSEEKAKAADLEKGAPAHGSSHRRELAQQRGLAAVRLLAYAVAGTVLFASPSALLMSLIALTWKGSVNMGPLLSVMVFLILVMFVPCCLGCCGRKSSHWLLRLAWRRLCFVLVAVLAGFLFFASFSMYLFFNDVSVAPLREGFDPELPVAVVGGGASGLTAAWLLAMGGRRVEVFEALAEVGGHSKTWLEAGGNSSGGDLSVDLGFIFNSENYLLYRNLTDYLGVQRVDSALNISRSTQGRYWDNTNRRPRYSQELEEEIDRFLTFVNEEPSTFRYMVPFGMWAWQNGFSEDFLQLCLESTMTVLFVTKMGLYKQSTQAVLDYIGRGGYVHMRYDPERPEGLANVQTTRGGSQNVWRRVAQEIQANGGQIHVNRRLAYADKEDGRWSLAFADGSRAAGFGEVVLALPANVAKDVVRGAAVQSGFVAQIEYVEADVTLHTDYDNTVRPDFEQHQVPSEVLYFVTEGHMTGYIGRIAGEPQSPLLLSVVGEGQDGPRIEPDLVKWSTKWSHHYFSLWEICIARKIVPFFNGIGGMIYAGDWVWGVGHNDAMKSGAAAACLAGIPRTPQVASAEPLYTDLLRKVCK